MCLINLKFTFLVLERQPLCVFSPSWIFFSIISHTLFFLILIKMIFGCCCLYRQKRGIQTKYDERKQRCHPIKSFAEIFRNCPKLWPLFHHILIKHERKMNSTVYWVLQFFAFIRYFPSLLMPLEVALLSHFERVCFNFFASITPLRYFVVGIEFLLLVRSCGEMLADNK